MCKNELERAGAGGTGVPALKFIGWSALLMLAGALTGCHEGRNATETKPAERAASSKGITNSEQNVLMEKQMKNATKGHLIVSKPNNTGRLVQLGTLNFDEKNRATLSTEGSGPAVEELKTIWAEISKMKELTWKQSRPGEIDGEKVMRIVGEKAKPGDDNYIYAVLNTLERKYGYAVDLAH
jgi:hypothetical protein